MRISTYIHDRVVMIRVKHEGPFCVRLVDETLGEHIWQRLRLPALIRYPIFIFYVILFTLSIRHRRYVHE